jgi:hypothetical protein
MKLLTTEQEKKWSLFVEKGEGCSTDAVIICIRMHENAFANIYFHLFYF